MLQIMRKMFYKRMTKRFVLATLALLLCSASVSASDGDQQDGKNSERAVGAVEGGVQLGICESLDGYGAGLNVGAEVRYNLKGAPVDVGLLADANIFFGSPFSHNAKFSAVGDYNFNQVKWCSQFVGCGVGIGSYSKSIFDFEGGGEDDKIYSTCFISPRVGLEMFKFLRLTCTLDVPLSDFSFTSFSVSVGVCVGGKNKKSKR